MRRILMVCAAVAALGLAASTVHNAQAAGKKYKIVMEWTEVDTTGQFIMTKHANNLLDDLGEKNVDMELLTYGFAVNAVTKTRPQTLHAKELEELTRRGVKVVACENAMKFFKVEKSELLPFMGTVHSAMGEIVRKHAAGWQILRP